MQGVKIRTGWGGCDTICGMSTVLSLDSLYQQIEGELDQVRAAVRRHWTEAFQLVYGPSATPPRLGGKLMRPALCLLSAGAAGAAGAQDLARFEEMATAMELLHLAALAHDDVVDGASLRRGSSSLNVLWDNHTAVLGGDYLVARALMVLTVYDSCEIISSALESIHEMAEGELVTFGRGKGNLTEEDCIRLAEKKTASLFAVTCSTPCLLVDGADRQAMHDYGMGLGTAFQLVDDMLDLEKDESVLGKPSCGDIVEGKTTLPILYMREALSAKDRLRLDSMSGRPLSREDREWVASMARSTGAQERTNAIARKYVDEARGALASVPQSPWVEALRGMAEFVLIRDF